jgi:asparagine synthase (glutamine-hydrolysing)
MGFAVPIGRWFRTDYGGMKALMLDTLTARDPFGPLALDRRAVRRLVEEHLESRDDHGHRLFALLTLALWARDLPDRDRRASGAGS